jgi:phosphocarrier protein
MTAPTAETTSIPIKDPLGLHARPAVKLTKLAKTFQSRIEVARDAGGPWIDAKSVAKVMAAKAPRDTVLHIRAEGDDAAAAVAAIAGLVARNFEEEATRAAPG